MRKSSTDDDWRHYGDRLSPLKVGTFVCVHDGFGHTLSGWTGVVSAISLDEAGYPLYRVRSRHFANPGRTYYWGQLELAIPTFEGPICLQCRRIR